MPNSKTFDIKPINELIHKYKPDGIINENNTISIKAEDFPRYFVCEVLNLPIKNRKEQFINKDIFIKFPRVRLCSNLSLNLSFTKDAYFSCDMQPLYEMETRKICDIICQ